LEFHKPLYTQNLPWFTAFNLSANRKMLQKLQNVSTAVKRISFYVCVYARV